MSTETCINVPPGGLVILTAAEHAAFQEDRRMRAYLTESEKRASEAAHHNAQMVQDIITIVEPLMPGFGHWSWSLDELRAGVADAQVRMKPGLEARAVERQLVIAYLQEEARARADSTPSVARMIEGIARHIERLCHHSPSPEEQSV